MKRKEFNIKINASKEKVWNVLWSSDTYPKWAATFCEGSYAETDWQEGNKVKFLGPDGNGMLSKIKKNEPYNLMFIEHIGAVMDGVEDTESKEAKKWKGGIENYRLTAMDGKKTELHVETDIAEEYLDSF